MAVIIALLVIALATHRVTKMVTQEPGPWRVFAWLRSRFGVIHNVVGQPVWQPETWKAFGITCVHCVSFWVAIALSLIFLYISPIPVFVLAVSGLLTLFYEWFDTWQSRTP